MNTGFITLILVLHAVSCLSFAPLRYPLPYPSFTSTREASLDLPPRSDSPGNTSPLTSSIFPSTSALPKSSPLSSSRVMLPFPITTAFPVLSTLSHRSTSTSSPSLSEEEVERVKSISRRYCGPGIPNVLRVVCGGRYRRDVSGAGAWAWIVRPTPGIVDECCRSECNLEVLTSYCAPNVTPDIATFAKYHEGIAEGAIRYADFEGFR